MSAIAFAISSFIVRRDLVIGLRDALGVEILADFFGGTRARALLFESRHDHGERVAVGFGAGKSELFRRPQPEQLVAPRGRFELQFLVVRELLFEGFFALVECRHGPALMLAFGLLCACLGL